MYPGVHYWYVLLFESLAEWPHNQPDWLNPKVVEKLHLHQEMEE